MPSPTTKVDTFDLHPGRVIGGKYVVDSFLGSGYEGEVYRVVERRTGAMRAAKVFYPERNERDRAVSFHARKLEDLRSCEIVVRYHHSESLTFRGRRLTAMISEYVDGPILHEFVSSRSGKRLPEFEALHILHRLAAGVEQVHAKGEYHGDIHSGNVLIRRRGVHFDVKLLDLHDHGRSTASNIQSDVVDMVRLLHEMLGGRTRYRFFSPEVKAIICALRQTTITRRFPTAHHLRSHLDSFEWSEA